MAPTRPLRQVGLQLERPLRPADELRLPPLSSGEQLLELLDGAPLGADLAAQLHGALPEVVVGAVDELDGALPHQLHAVVQIERALGVLRTAWSWERGREQVSDGDPTQEQEHTETEPTSSR